MSLRDKHITRTQELKESLNKPVPASAIIDTMRTRLYGKQFSFYSDQSKRKVATCSRQCGKTWGAAEDLVVAALTKNNADNIYVTLTRVSAKKIIWKDLNKVVEEYAALGYTQCKPEHVKINNSELSITFPNKSTVYLFGAKDDNDIEKIRGLRLNRVILDECQSWKDRLLEYLVKTVLPMSTLHNKGTIAMIGTPNAACQGFFYNAFHGINKVEGWTAYNWNIYDLFDHLKTLNPQDPPDIELALKEAYLDNGIKKEDPIYQREALGKWVKSFENSIYKYTEELNTYEGAKTLNPKWNWYYVLGMDFGLSDECAWVVWAYSPSSPNVYVVETYNKAGIIPSKAAVITKAYMEKYDFTKIVGDTGGMGKAFTEEMRQRHQIPVVPAQKRDRLNYIKNMNDDFRTGKIKIEKNADLAEEWSTLQWEVLELKEREGQDNHLADAALYGWRECKHFLYEEPEEEKTETDPGFMSAYEKKIEEEYHKEKEDDLDYPTGGDPYDY